MPVQSPHHNSHFNVIVDDCTSAIAGGCFAKKNQALSIIKSTINNWEVVFNEKAVAVRLDGTKEFHGDEAKQWFEGKGISNVHAENGSLFTPAEWQGRTLGPGNRE